MSYGYIYKIQFPNGKHYIGLTTTSIEQRTKEHKRLAKSDDTRYLYNALRYYNMVDTLKLIEIDTADTLEELRKKEIGYIIEYNSYYKNGYNMTFGGDGANGYVHTEDDNQKKSERMIQHYKNHPEAGKKYGEKIKQYYEDHPEAKEQMSKIKKKHYENPKAIQKCSEAGKKYHEDHPEAGKEHGEKMKQYYEDRPEAKQKCSEIKKKYHEDHPEAGKEHGERMKKYYDNPEAKQKCSEAGKKYHEDHPEAGKEHGKRMKKRFEDNPEAKKKILDTKGQNKPFDVFKIDGTFIKTFTYQFEAKEYLQKEYDIITIINTGDVLAEKRKSSAGFVFIYK